MKICSSTYEAYISLRIPLKKLIHLKVIINNEIIISIWRLPFVQYLLQFLEAYTVLKQNRAWRYIMYNIHMTSILKATSSSSSSSSPSLMNDFSHLQYSKFEATANIYLSLNWSSWTPRVTELSNDNIKQTSTHYFNNFVNTF